MYNGAQSDHVLFSKRQGGHSDMGCRYLSYIRASRSNSNLKHRIDN